MSASLYDELPALEAAPSMHFSLTHLSEAAAQAKKRGVKRGRDHLPTLDADDTDDEESDFSHDSDEGSEAEEELEASPVAAYSAAALAAPAMPASAGGLWDEADDAAPRSRRTARPKKEAEVDGVGRARFPIVQTIHATAFLGREVSVETIARRCFNAIFCPPSCVRFTIRHPFGIAMVYSSGKYVCMGGKSTVDMVTIARKVARKIQRIGNLPGTEDYKEVGFHNFSLNNISANAAFGYRLNLRALSEDPSFADYTEYEPEQWKGLHYKLPVDPNKTLADLLPSYAYLLAQRHKKEQFSSDEFLGVGEHALVGAGKGALSYYATTGTTGNRAPKTAASAAAAARAVPLKVPPSLNGQILTATIYANGRLTLTGVRKECDIHNAYLRLWRILQPFATSLPPEEPPVRPPYPRAFLPGQRRQIKLEAEAAAASVAAGVPYSVAAAAAAAASLYDVKPNIAQATSSVTSAMFVLPVHVPGVKQQPVLGTFAVKQEAPATSHDAPPSADATSLVKHEAPPPVEFATTGLDVASAIVIEGLPEHQPHAPEGEDDVEWE